MLAYPFGSVQMVHVHKILVHNIQRTRKIVFFCSRTIIFSTSSCTPIFPVHDDVVEKYIFPTKNDNNSDSRSKYTFLEEHLVDPIIAGICKKI